MRCVVTLKDGDAMERAMGALAKYRYTVGDEQIAPAAHPKQWSKWLLEIDSAELETIRDHVDAGDIVDTKLINEQASAGIH